MKAASKTGSEVCEENKEEVENGYISKFNFVGIEVIEIEEDCLTISRIELTFQFHPFTSMPVLLLQKILQ